MLAYTARTRHALSRPAYAELCIDIVKLHAGPSAWNRLSEDIRAEPNIANFWKLLKTHYFIFLTFNNCIL